MWNALAMVAMAAVAQGPGDCEPELLLTNPQYASAFRLTASGDLAFVSIDKNVFVVNVSDPESPVTLGVHQRDDAGTQRVELMGVLMLVPKSAWGLEIVDISDPTSPALLARYTVGDKILSAAPVDSLVYLTTHGQGFHIIDLADPEQPVLIGAAPTIGQSMRIAIENDIAVVATTQGVQTFDVSDPAEPVSLGFLQLADDWIYDLDLRDGIAYVSNRQAGFRIVDVTDPTSPKLAATVPIGECHNATLRGDAAFVSDVYVGVQVVDVSDPLAPKLGTLLELPDQCAMIDIVGDTLFAAAGNSGLAVVDVSTCVCPADVNGDGALTILDFVTFQLLWQSQDPAADCNEDTAFDITDFTCFQQRFQAGCH